MNLSSGVFLQHGVMCRCQPVGHVKEKLTFQLLRYGRHSVNTLEDLYTERPRVHIVYSNPPTATMTGCFTWTLCCGKPKTESLTRVGVHATPGFGKYAAETGKMLASNLKSLAGMIPVPFVSQLAEIAINVIEVCEVSVPSQVNGDPVSYRIIGDNRHTRGCGETSKIRLLSRPRNHPQGRSH
jgi:hypothetical protein